MSAADPLKRTREWEVVLGRRLPLFGHRNWIVIADAAYPHQSADGIVTIVADGDLLTVTERVLALIAQAKHVKANVYTDRELNFVDEHDAPGVDAFRRELARLVQGAELKQLPHEEIIAKLDRAARAFSILIIKTTTLIPYTSVCFELDCGYWNAAAENRLRAAIATD
jgi:L-fucose mutarotase/ribose pyranase (RbsD/FucU family)